MHTIEFDKQVFDYVNIESYVEKFYFWYKGKSECFLRFEKKIYDNGLVGCMLFHVPLEKNYDNNNNNNNDIK